MSDVTPVDWFTVSTQLHPSDSVAVVKRNIAAGSRLRLPGVEVDCPQSIPAGHKVALCSISPGEPVLKYGQYIGRATQPIFPGDHVHSHNLAAGELPGNSERLASRLTMQPYTQALAHRREFMGYSRPTGRVGTRNYLAVISSVNCSASVSRYVAEAFRGPDFSRDFPNVDGVIAMTHKSGCAMDPGEPTRLLQQVLAGVACHPNVGGYVLIGLGCEVNQVAALAQNRRIANAPGMGSGPAVLNIQQAGGARKTVEAGVAAVKALLPRANDSRREPHPASKLTLGLNCGGSDGYSGCTANPALGVASDMLVAQGGASVLAETPEIFGAEHLLAQRATSPEVRDRLMALIAWWEEHARRHNTSIDNNPSFGNRQGGLTTIYEKSLGAIAKAGQAPLTAVYQYAETIDVPGLSFMDTPGYDPVSMTGLMAGGCNVAVFTTGRGSVYGCKPTPCIKVASNSVLYQRQSDDMDINAGGILDGSTTISGVGAAIFEEILAVASGKQTRSELCGMGDEEFAPWILGPTL